MKRRGDYNKYFNSEDCLQVIISLIIMLLQKLWIRIKDICAVQHQQSKIFLPQKEC